jgi:hypothetical protein
MPDSAIPTITELRDQRAAAKTEIDDILNTAKEAQRAVLDPDERERHDAAEALYNSLTEAIRAKELEDGDSDRFERNISRSRDFAPVSVNLNREAVRGGRSLDELLWATDEMVRAGTVDKTGNIRQPGPAYNPVEQVIVRSAVDDEGIPAPRINEFLPEHRQVVRSFQKTVADMSLFGMMIDRDANSRPRASRWPAATGKFKDRWQNILRALDTDTAAEGTEWVPTGIGANLHEKVRAAGKVAPLFTRIDLPTNPWKWPIEGADATAYRVPEPTGDTEAEDDRLDPRHGGSDVRRRDLRWAHAVLPFARGRLGAGDPAVRR